MTYLRHTPKPSMFPPDYVSPLTMEERQANLDELSPPPRMPDGWVLTDADASFDAGPGGQQTHSVEAGGELGLEDESPYFIPSKDRIRVTLNIRSVKDGTMLPDDDKIIF